MWEFLGGGGKSAGCREKKECLSRQVCIHTVYDTPGYMERNNDTKVLSPKHSTLLKQMSGRF